MKNNNSTRELLKQLLEGRRPVLNVSLIEVSDAHTWVDVDRKASKLLPNAQVEPYIEEIRQAHPIHDVREHRMNRAEVEVVNARLEAEY